MKILAKSALRADQIAVRKSLAVDGIEIILLSEDMDNYSQALDKLRRAADDFSVVGLEAPCEDKDLVINPISDDIFQSRKSRDYLFRCVDLINGVKQGTDCEAYFQYQYSFDSFDQGKPRHGAARKILLERIVEFHHELQHRSDVPLQIENGTPIGIRKNQPMYLPVTAGMEEFGEMPIPLALDIAHLAISLYTWSKAVKDGELYRVATPLGSLSIEMSDAQSSAGAYIGESFFRGTFTRDTITAIINRFIHIYHDLIGSLQFSNAKPGVGTDVHDEGYAGMNGLLDVERVFREAIIPLNIPYVIPEYEEDDYLHPTHQRDAIEMVRRLQGTLSC